MAISPLHVSLGWQYHGWVQGGTNKIRVLGSLPWSSSWIKSWWHALQIWMSVISATSIYLITLVITNAVYICPMLIDGCSNIWWGGRSAGKNKINIWARTRSKYLGEDEIFDPIKKSIGGIRTRAQTRHLQKWCNVPTAPQGFYIAPNGSLYTTSFQRLCCYTWSSSTQRRAYGVGPTPVPLLPLRVLSRASEKI